MPALWIPFPAAGAVPAEYCSTPPFLSNTVPPNVLIVLDNSGSMNDWAYSTSYDSTKYVPADPVKRGYYGYFEPSKKYKYSGTEWAETTDTTGTIANPIATGDFLNWATMRRIDVARKLLIGGKATPRSPNPGATVALYGETAPSPSWDFAKTNSEGRLSPFPTTSYSYVMSGDSLSVAPNNPLPKVPKSNANTNWSFYPSSSTQYRTVDEKTANEADYLYNNTNNSSQLFGYTAFTSSDITVAIQSVTVSFRAKKTATSTNRIKGVIKVGGTEYQHSNYTNLSTSWEDYEFTWTANPATGLAWTLDDLTNTSSAYYLSAFGVYNVTAPTSTLYPKVTWIELAVSLSAPSGGPYKIKVDWKGEVWAYEQGIIPGLGDEARFGLAFYNSGSGYESGYSNGRYDGGYVANIVNFSQPTNMITTIHNMTPNTWTPLGETLFEMVRYFRQDGPYYTGNSPADFSVGFNSASDPFYFDYPSGSVLPDQYVPCVKSFILLLTDGESTKDRNIPSTATGVPGSKDLRDYDGDGRDDGGSGDPVYSSDGSDYLDDVALWARTEDARPGTCSGTTQSAWTQPCIPGNQNITTYSVFMFGTGSQLLKDAAINGGFEDKNGNNLPDCSTIPAECYRETDNVGGLSSNDLPITYFEGDDGYDLHQKILEAITSILRRAASGTAVSVLTTSSRGVGSMLQAYFLPVRQEGTREVTWTGNTQNIWLDLQDNLREDTINDSKLKLAEDKAIKLYFDTLNSETMVASFRTDADGNSDGSPGTLSSCDPETTKKFTDISYLWEGGKKLALKRPSTRSIFTSKKSIVGTTTTTLDSTTWPKQPVFDTSMDSTVLKPALNADATYTADNIIRYIRGECLETGVSGDAACTNTASSTYRDRRITVSGGDTYGNVWKLGDIISSTPKVFSATALNAYHMVYNDGTYMSYISSDDYKKRSSTISSMGFIGANDGMLHAIRVGYLKDKNDVYGDLDSTVKALFKNFFTNADTANDQLGEEVWAYIPFNAFPYLKYLADPTYCHIYYSDLTVNLVDVSIGAPTGCTETDTALCTKTADSWKTVLIGGMRFGAACSGGISPTGPPAGTPANVGFSSFYALDITNPVNPVPMWEFTDPDLGYATTYPAVLRTGETNLNGHWYAVIGSGAKKLPKSGQDIDRTTPGYIYILDLKAGTRVKMIPLDHNAIVGDILAVDANRDYKSEKLYFGTAYKDTTWKGKLVSIAIPDQDLTQTWTPAVTYLVSDNYPFTASPDAVLDEKRQVWVYQGSGKYYSDVDETDSSQQIFLGIKHASGIAYPLTTASLDNRTNVPTTGTVTGTTQACIFNSSTNDFALTTMVTSISRTSAAASTPANGWYINLATSPTAERVVSRPLAIGGLVDFLSYKPNADPCAAGGDSYLYSLAYTTGVAPENVAIMHPDTTGGVTTGSVTVQKGIKLGPGAPPTGEAIIIPPPKEEDAQKDKFKKKIQVATGVIVEAEDETAYSLSNKILHWLKK
jgi:type IV pilus assembly protein PilY1